MKTQYPPEWRTQSKWKKKFYARYMTWLERIGYIVVVCVLGAFIFAFNYRVDDVITADKVAISAQFTPVETQTESLIVEQLVADFTEVVEGEPLFSIVTGSKEIKEFQAWVALREIGETTLVKRPPVKNLVATSAGTFVANLASPTTVVEPNTEIGQIRNYNQLTLSPSLVGQGVAKAQSGGIAKIKNISVEPMNGLVFRGQSAESPILSTAFGSPELKSEISKILAGQAVKVRDDISLQIAEVTEIQIDAGVTSKPSLSQSGITLDPLVTDLLEAKVTEGSHSASIQFANLPSNLQAQIRTLIQGALTNQEFLNHQSKAKTIQQVSNLSTVFKAKATASNGSPAGKIQAANLSRSFDAKVVIESPPQSLIQAVLRADKQGKAVTAKVELKTGDRPIATLLLKRS